MIELKIIYRMSLFNNIEDFRECVPWLYATTDFDRFKLDIELAIEEVKSVTGRGVYELAVAGTNEELTRHFRLPVALFAYFSYCENADVSHEEDGRKVKIDGDTEKLAWEWMIERDNAAMLKKANKAVDRLIAYLDDNIETIDAWRGSEQRRDLNRLFVKSATEFDSVVPIERSRAFFLRVLPFVRAADREMMKYVGKERYDELKVAMVCDELGETQRRVVELCREVIPHLVMAKAVRRLAIDVLPDSVVTRFSSERQTMKASLPASLDLIASMEAIYLKDAGAGIVMLQDFIHEISPGKAYVGRVTDYRDEKFFSV